MTPKEQALLQACLDCTNHYVEFGSGGSTVLAFRTVAGTITSVDSSSKWLDSVATHCQQAPNTNKLNLIHVDIGPLKELGYPADETRRDHWPDYHTGVWDKIKNTAADTYLIDGRFRVACFIQTLLHASSDAIVLVHDFRNRNIYSVMNDFGREIIYSENLSVFVKRPNFNPGRAHDVLRKFEFNAS